MKKFFAKFDPSSHTSVRQDSVTLRDTFRYLGSKLRALLMRPAEFGHSERGNDVAQEAAGIALPIGCWAGDGLRHVLRS